MRKILTIVLMAFVLSIVVSFGKMKAVSAHSRVEELGGEVVVDAGGGDSSGGESGGDTGTSDSGDSGSGSSSGGSSTSGYSAEQIAAAKACLYSN